MNRFSKHFKLHPWQLWVIVSVIIVAIIVPIISSIVYYVDINKKLETPTNLSIHKIKDQIFAEVNKVKGTKYYEFVFGYDGIEKTYVSKKSAFKVPSSFMNKGGEYSIKCRAVGKTSASASEYCTQDYENYIQIPPARIAVNDVKKRIDVCFYEDFAEDVELRFVLNYGIKNDDTPLQITEFDKETSSFDITFLYESEKKEYWLSVSITSTNNEYYLPSFSEPLFLEVQ